MEDIFIKSFSKLRSLFEHLIELQSLKVPMIPMISLSVLKLPGNLTMKVLTIKVSEFELEQFENYRDGYSGFNF